MNVLAIIDRNFEKDNTELIGHLKSKQSIRVIEATNSCLEKTLASYKGLVIWATNQIDYNSTLWHHMISKKHCWFMLMERTSPKEILKLVDHGINFITLGDPKRAFVLNNQNYKLLRLAIDILSWSAEKLLIEEHSLNVLSKKENEVINLLLEGYEDKEIAKRLYISDKTVRNHISNILKKVSLKNRTQLVLWALSQKGEI
ncbi:LuxR C-terminal-related transcriptional regulator [Proteinivorax hydrogeniformans]|uniref:LuxR C-terminal-related transcriptional regulator n=1 Tax=Proteinivorax hydrogeniformans TaxID=1826727 RepID=A0AAU8HV35_9FIRM